MMKNKTITIQPIRNNSDYQSALAAVSEAFDNPPLPNSAEGDQFDVLITLIQAYEAKHFPIDLPDPIDAIKFRMEQAGLSPKDLEPAIGRSNRVYEVLNGKRRLTLSMVWRLHTMFGIPTDSLVKPPQAA
jgi:HTH-type transcriptional regulator / antitoxin HigA